MTTETVSFQPACSLADQAFMDAETEEEQLLVGEYLDFCERVAEHTRCYLHTHRNDLATACRYIGAMHDQTQDAWMQADHDERIRMLEDQDCILRQIAACSPTAETRALSRECRKLIDALRWIRTSVLFDRTDEWAWEGDV